MIQIPKRLLNVITSLYWELRGDAAPVLKHNNALPYSSEILWLAKAKKKVSRVAERHLDSSLWHSARRSLWLTGSSLTWEFARNKGEGVPPREMLPLIICPCPRASRSAGCLAPANYGKPTLRCRRVNINPNDAAEPAQMCAAVWCSKPAAASIFSTSVSPDNLAHLPGFFLFCVWCGPRLRRDEMNATFRRRGVERASAARNLSLLSRDVVILYRGNMLKYILLYFSAKKNPKKLSPKERTISFWCSQIQQTTCSVLNLCCCPSSLPWTWQHEQVTQTHNLANEYFMRHHPE